ncbi:concanavalin A-like lectin/glucanase domain-containing protein [Sphaerosporella brunnea]|uniref:Concanavalin A-like lectin/glucanase domain-containing protein n=1 Tax=Sphaerosporella brunnea TaxID=1250544 RepID=A0A5J5F456_9PEZI|nr:concanavalin A-like lectin/glucanase domain-containing protein [Sphaerosporella brunnea]
MKLNWSLLAVAAAFALGADAAQFEVDPDFSIGSRFPISDDRRTVPNFQIFGAPQLFGDRIILTPPAPGNQRVGVWSRLPNPHDEWTLTTEFRANGGERAGGSLNLWYTARGFKDGSGSGTDTIYTSTPWDGLALVIDSHSGAPQVRGYLNDGRTNYANHHNPISLAFGHCDLDYRNKGALTQLTLTQTSRLLKVEVDGRLCFQTEKARLPKGYYFGVTAATSEIPDSFELFKFVLSAPKGATHEQLNSQQHQQQQQQRYERYDQMNQPKGHGKQADGEQPHDQAFEKWHAEVGENDHEATYYKTHEEQFADLHNRMQALTHHLASIQNQLGMFYDHIDSLHHKDEEWRQEARHSRPPRDQIDRMDARLQVIENLAMQIAGAITSKDYTQHFDELRNTLKEHHMNLLYSVPESVSHVLTTGGPKIGMMVTIVVLVQVGLAVAYVIYKKRRNSSPKKYL